jgi:hypothetical protein
LLFLAPHRSLLLLLLPLFQGSVTVVVVEQLTHWFATAFAIARLLLPVMLSP